ncbi:TPA: response regulator transcription factor [Enterococcus faecalis]|uniref:Transcriptional regulator n=3 Tax=Enterococcus faecalis TaxID=1351 RepID=Q832I1_ENTFA|nr:MULTISPECIES: winged helix-turn-helix domain-containing protein [Enterococcus]MBU5556165.1 winged helix-turn-helix domain-containing protein [Enterococcus sp. S157_ASV_20]MBU5560052.1 winged helix-turn-helix domain-containing protein [Enterococcus sp. S115_ASV_20]MBU5577316.1 winged helix-turn-helix domain-containing protein [Enterococcus sp. S131_ASV_20]CPW52489.1 Transcriptional regulatory protein%2C C terminal [Mycobacteroides abscessus]AAO81976.1 transcriptional regulator [Enterococcus 
MTRVLIIARSPLAEQELECTLQRSFDEVFCSSELMKEVEKYSLVTQYFSVVIFSDTISTSEMATYLPYFKKLGLSILRKGQKEQLKTTEYTYLIDEIDDWFDEQTSPNVLIEKIVKLDNKSQKNRIPNLRIIESVQKSIVKRDQVIIYFTKNERKLLYYLYKSKGKCVSRRELCQLMWGEEISNSSLSQLSTLVAHVREKLTHVGFEELWIKTIWGRGYILSDEFIDYLSQNNTFSKGRVSKLL